MTKIEWTHRPGTTGVTWNPVTGCTPISEGCANCYARRMAKRLAGRHGYPEAPHEFNVTLHPDKLENPLKWRKPRTVFVCSMSDLFHEDVPLWYISLIWSVMTQTPQHTYLVLTKRADRMLEIMTLYMRTPPPNIWLGVTVENQQRADGRIPLLLQCPATVRYVSIEPMLGPVDLDAYWGAPEGLGEPVGLDWIIVGGETGPGARPMNPDWARDVRDQCKAAGVPFFFKQMAGKAPIPDDLMIREWPEAR